MKVRSQPQAHSLVYLLLGVLLVSPLLHAGESTPLSEALGAMRKRDYFSAMNILQEATKANPDDTQQWFFLAVACNKLRLYESALKALGKAQFYGHESPSLHQERGKALLGLGRPREALAELEKGPKTADNHMLLATAALATRNPSRALTELDAAMRLDPSSEPRIRLIRASILGRQGRLKAARAELSLGRLKRVDRDTIDRYDRLDSSLDDILARRDKRWGVNFVLGTVYTNNPTLDPTHTIPPRRRLVRQNPTQDVFLTESVSGWYRLLGDRRTGVIGRARFSGAHYDRVDDRKRLAAYASLMGYHTLNPFRLEAGISYGHEALGGDEYKRERGIWATARWRQTDWTRTSVTLDATDRSYFFNFPKQRDVDGMLYTIDLKQQFKVPVADRSVRITPYLQLGWEETDGKSAENHFWTAGLSARVPIVQRLDMFGYAGYRDRQFDEPHELVQYRERRHDLERMFGLGLDWTVAKHVDVTLQWDHIDSGSNMHAFYAYRVNLIAFYVRIHY